MKVVFIGAGPGDPDLITLKGKKILEQAQVVIYAGSLVSPDILEYSSPNAVMYNSAGMNLEEVTGIYMKEKNNSGIIARVHTGDPSIYGAIQEQIDFCRRNEISIQVIPGVSSFQAAAAILEQELTLPGVSQTVILTRISGRTKTPEREDLSLLAAARATMIIFLSVKMAGTVAEKLMKEYPSDTPAAVVYRASWEDQKVIHTTLKELADSVAGEGIEKHALIIVGDVLKGMYELSKLYDPSFSHLYRRGKDRKQA